MDTVCVIGTRRLEINHMNQTEHENIAINVDNFHERYSGKADEHILDAIEKHISVPYDAKESVQAHQHAYELVQFIVDKSQEIEPTLKMKIIESGSFFSNLRVGLPYEFDFMLDITSTFSDGELDYGYSEKIPGEYLYRIHPNKNDSIFKQNSLSAQNIKTVLFGLFHRVITDNRECDTKWKKSKYDTDDEKNSECDTRWKMSNYDADDEGNLSGPAFRISLHYKDTAILIDLVPCLKFPAADMRTELPQLQHTTEVLLKRILSEDQLRMYLQNIPEKLFLVCKSYGWENEGAFRLSTSHIEKDIFLNNLDHKLLQALKIAKYYFQILFIGLNSGNVNTFGRDRDRISYVKNAHPFSSKSYLPSYMITNLFFHFLKILMWFPCQNSHESSFCNNIVMMFIKFVHTIIGHQMPLAISKRNKWDRLYITLHGWCFCHTNAIKVLFTDYEHSYFRNSMAQYIQVLENISNVFELQQFPLVGRTPDICCKKCFDKKFHFTMEHNRSNCRLKLGECQLHSWPHQKELLAFPSPRH